MKKILHHYKPGSTLATLYLLDKGKIYSYNVSVRMLDKTCYVNDKDLEEIDIEHLAYNLYDGLPIEIKTVVDSNNKICYIDNKLVYSDILPTSRSDNSISFTINYGSEAVPDTDTLDLDISANIELIINNSYIRIAKLNDMIIKIYDQ